MEKQILKFLNSQAPEFFSNSRSDTGEGGHRRAQSRVGGLSHEVLPIAVQSP